MPEEGEAVTSVEEEAPQGEGETSVEEAPPVKAVKCQGWQGKEREETCKSENCAQPS